ncbi:hypothetical protein [uncultured Tateyamaria sp.]|uniref:hypothetical protein n=1 Tax=uncultured Tateyamaria sp. TaxID=455651 RepID=UPI00261ABC9A|nr:hypothetical protein [uncultured Tateyamaria sp.]
MIRALSTIGRHGQFCLIAGLVAGLLLPGVAAVLTPWIGTMVALLLFVTGMRVGARRAFGNLEALRPTLTRLVILQTVLPVVVAVCLTAIGVIDAPIALAVVLMLSAPSLTGGPNFAIMLGHDPAPGMRLLVLGTALFPLTALPVLMIVDPVGTGALGAVSLSFGLLSAIVIAVGCGFAVRRMVPRLGERPAQQALDGCAAILLGVVVVGLMNAIGPLVRAEPLELVWWLVAALVINFTLVLVTLWLCRRFGWTMSLATGIYAGNRNIALFLIVLPPEVAAPLMIFVGCYQIPMYLTPFLLGRFKQIAA